MLLSLIRAYSYKNVNYCPRYSTSCNAPLRRRKACDIFLETDGGAIPISTASEGQGPEEDAGKGRIAEGPRNPNALVLDVRANTRRLSRKIYIPRSAIRTPSLSPAAPSWAGLPLVSMQGNAFRERRSRSNGLHRHGDNDG